MVHDDQRADPGQVGRCNIAAISFAVSPNQSGSLGETIFTSGAFWGILGHDLPESAFFRPKNPVERTHRNLSKSAPRQLIAAAPLHILGRAAHRATRGATFSNPNRNGVALARKKRFGCGGFVPAGRCAS
jgi:hypothetical protein